MVRRSRSASSAAGLGPPSPRSAGEASRAAGSGPAIHRRRPSTTPQIGRRFSTTAGLAAHLANSGPTSIADIPLIVEEILLRLPSPGSLCRAALASKTWLRAAGSKHVLGEYHKRHNSQPLLGLYVPSDHRLFPTHFYAARSALEDRALVRFVLGKGLLLPQFVLGFKINWYPLDCHGGRVLLGREGENGQQQRKVFDAVSVWSFEEFEPLADGAAEGQGPQVTTIAECLLQGDRDSFCLVSVQHNGLKGRDSMVRAVEFSSRTREWLAHAWASNVDKPYHPQAMHAGTRYIFWRYKNGMVLVLDTSTMCFSKRAVPLFQPFKYAIRDTEDGTVCLVGLEGPSKDQRFQLWLLEENGVLKPPSRLLKKASGMNHPIWNSH